MTIVGIIMVTAMVNLLIGSALADWALLAPIFVPILMQVGLAPELTQEATIPLGIHGAYTYP